MVEHGNGLLEVDLDPRADRLRLVIVALDKGAAVRLASLGRRRVGALADWTDRLSPGADDF